MEEVGVFTLKFKYFEGSLKIKRKSSSKIKPRDLKKKITSGHRFDENVYLSNSIEFQTSGTWKRNQSPQLFTDTMNGTFSSQSFGSDVLDGDLENSLANSPATPTHEARSRLLRPKSLVERARLNVGYEIKASLFYL